MRLINSTGKSFYESFQRNLSEENKPNKACERFKVGDRVRFLHAGDQPSEEVAKITGYDEEGYYTYTWQDGEKSSGATDANLVPENYESLNGDVNEEETVEPLNADTITEGEEVQVRDPEPKRNYSITDITELNQVADGDVRPPMVDITQLLVGVDESLKESDSNWGHINILSTRTSEQNASSNALLELRLNESVYLMSMIVEGDKALKEFKVNDTLGKNIFSRKTTEPQKVMKEYIESFIPAKVIKEAEKKDKIENAVEVETIKEVPLKNKLETLLSKHGYEELKMRYDYLLWSTKNGLDKKAEDYEDALRMVKKSIYALVAELPYNSITPEQPNNDEEQKLKNFDAIVEELFGKDFVCVRKAETEDKVVPSTEGTEVIKEAEQFKVYTTSGRNGTYKSEEYGTYNSEDQASDTVAELKAQGMGATYERVGSIEEVDQPIEGPEEEQPKEGLGTGSATFVRKPANVEDVRNSIKSGVTDGKSTYIIVDEKKLSDEEFEELANNLQDPRSFLEGVTPIDDENYAFNVLKVIGPNYSLLIDPSGFNYPRYVAISE